MNEQRILAAVLCGITAGALAITFKAAAPAVARAVTRRRRALAAIAERAADVSQARVASSVLAAGAAAGAIAGFTFLGAAGVVIGGVAGPFAVRAAARSRRARFASQIDECAGPFALALASALAGGSSIRGALLVSARATPEPLASELNRVSVDLALGATVEEALTGLTRSTASTRLAALSGAILLSSESGGDLVGLTRELAEAFRARDGARRDARASTAQARFTAIVVAAIPLVLGAVCEVARPGSVSGAFSFAPTALMMLCALGLLAGGSLLALRTGRVQ